MWPRAYDSVTVSLRLRHHPSRAILTPSLWANMAKLANFNGAHHGGQRGNSSEQFVHSSTSRSRRAAGGGIGLPLWSAADGEVLLPEGTDADPTKAGLQPVGSWAASPAHRRPRQTVQQWFQILRDTSITFDLPARTATVKRKAIAAPKLYFFGLGVVRALRRLPRVAPESADFGELFEHFVFLEVRARTDYRRPRTRLRYWRTTSGFKVDLAIGGTTAVEVMPWVHFQDAPWSDQLLR